jgi:hypothetical protein
MRDKQLLQGQNNMFLLKQKFGILPVRAINELDRGSSVSQSGAFSFATELPPPLPWPTRTSLSFSVGVVGLAGAPAASVAGCGASLFLLWVTDIPQLL